MIAEQLNVVDFDYEDIPVDSPAIVFWCDEQKEFSVELLSEWVSDKMNRIALVKEIHLCSVGVFESREEAYFWVASMQDKSLFLSPCH